MRDRGASQVKVALRPSGQFSALVDLLFGRPWADDCVLRFFPSGHGQRQATALSEGVSAHISILNNEIVFSQKLLKLLFSRGCGCKWRASCLGSSTRMRCAFQIAVSPKNTPTPPLMGSNGFLLIPRDSYEYPRDSDGQGA